MRESSCGEHLNCIGAFECALRRIRSHRMIPRFGSGDVGRAGGRNDIKANITESEWQSGGCGPWLPTTS
jgi:hypothetical protein